VLMGYAVECVCVIANDTDGYDCGAGKRK